LLGYIGVDWASNIDDRKSTSGGDFFLWNCLVAWLSKKQTFISLSIVEAKYIVIAMCCNKILEMKQTLQYMKVAYDE